MSPSHTRKIPVLPTIVTLIAVLILCGLGKWQLDRLAWKTDILTNLEKARQYDQQKTPLSSDTLKSVTSQTDFKAGFIEGRFHNDKETTVGPRTYRGIAGYHIITPFEMQDGTIILVNRGWVSEEYLPQSERREFLREGQTKVFGMARPSEKANRFTPDNKPNQNEWYHVDVAQIAKYNGFHDHDISPYIFYSEKLNKYYQGFPVPHDPAWAPNNNHLGYALFWFTMAGVLLIIYYLRFLRKPKDA
jgi:surfeit locus 1 family protein